MLLTIRHRVEVWHCTYRRIAAVKCRKTSRFYCFFKNKTRLTKMHVHIAKAGKYCIFGQIKGMQKLIRHFCKVDCFKIYEHCLLKAFHLLTVPFFNPEYGYGRRGQADLSQSADKSYTYSYAVPVQKKSCPNTTRHKQTDTLIRASGHLYISVLSIPLPSPLTLNLFVRLLSDYCNIFYHNNSSLSIAKTLIYAQFLNSFLYIFSLLKILGYMA